MAINDCIKLDKMLGGTVVPEGRIFHATGERTQGIVELKPLHSNGVVVLRTLLLYEFFYASWKKPKEVIVYGDISQDILQLLKEERSFQLLSTFLTEQGSIPIKQHLSTVDYRGLLKTHKTDVCRSAAIQEHMELHREYFDAMRLF